MGVKGDAIALGLSLLWRVGGRCDRTKILDTVEVKSKSAIACLMSNFHMT